MTDEPEIERCVCGAEAALTRSGNEDYPESMTPHCECQSWLTTGRSCWIGPQAATPEDALQQWNTLMRAARRRASTPDHSRRYCGAIVYCQCPDCTEHRSAGSRSSVGESRTGDRRSAPTARVDSPPAAPAASPEAR